MIRKRHRCFLLRGGMNNAVFPPLTNAVAFACHPWQGDDLQC